MLTEIDREKVIKGMECCANYLCDPKDCPYYENDHCENKLLHDALALLKAQEPQARTLGELFREAHMVIMDHGFLGDADRR